MRRRILLLGVLSALFTLLGLSVVTRPASAAIDTTTAANDYINLLNNLRAANGKAALTRDTKLDGVAQSWSAYMASSKNFEHRSNLGQAVAAIEPAWQGAGENIAYGGDDAGSIQRIHDSWVASAGHFKNMIGDYNRVGIGIVTSGGLQWVTVNFLLGPAISPPAPPAIPAETAPKVWAASGLTTINPVRLVDTRLSRPMSAGGVLEFRPSSTVAGSAGAQAIAVNLTVVNAAGDGFLTVWPCGAAMPNASNLNHGAGATKANQVNVAVGDGGKVCVYSQAGGHVLVDLAGYYHAGSGSRYTPLRPSRLLDTRNSGKTQNTRVTVPGGASAAGLNITVTEPDNGGFVTVWPCDQALPTASNVNFGPGETAANLVMSRVPGNGQVCLYSSVATHLIVDLQGTAKSSGSLIVPAEPRRAIDTRNGLGGRYGKVAGKVTQPLQVNLRTLNRVASNATGVLLNVTVTGANSGGWLSVYPCDEGLPATSNLNWAAGQTVANSVIAKLDGSGRICIASFSEAHVIADVNGWLA